MGYADYKLMLCDSQAVTEEVSDFYVDTEQTYPGWEKGVPMGVKIVCETAGAGSTGYVFHIVHKAGGAPTLGDSTLISVTAPIANLVKGAELIIPFPQGCIPILRYVGLHIADISADESLTISAWITPLPAIGG
jgi:hypothetical protein